MPESRQGGAEPRARRGDVVVVDLGPHRGQGPHFGRRMCVVVQNHLGNLKSPHTIVVPISKRKPDYKLYSVNVLIDPPEGGVKIPSYIDCGQLHTIPWGHIKEVLGTVSNESLSKIDEALRESLNLKRG